MPVYAPETVATVVGPIKAFLTMGNLKPLLSVANLAPACMAVLE